MNKDMAVLYDSINERIAELNSLRELLSETWDSQSGDLVCEKADLMIKKLAAAADEIASYRETE